jgi:hypothetical protein
MDTTVPRVEAARRWETLAPLTGIAAVLVFIAGFIVRVAIGDTPSDNAPAIEFTRYYQEEDGSIWWASILFFLAIGFFLWFAGSLRGALLAAEGGVGRLAATAHAGAITTAALVAASFGTQVSAAWLVSERTAPIAPTTAITYWFMSDGLFIAAFYTTAVLLAATGVVALRSGVFPRWFAWVTLLVALVLVIPWINGPAFIVAVPLWIIVTSYLLWQEASRALSA